MLDSEYIIYQFIIVHCSLYIVLFVIVPPTPTVGLGDRHLFLNDGHGLCVKTITDLRAQRFAHTSLIIIDKKRAA